MSARYSFFQIILLATALVACQKADSTPKPPPRVLVLTPEQYTFGGGTLIEALIEAAGGINAAHELNDYSQIGDSQILAMRPDVILFSSTWIPEQITAWVQASAYAELPAIRHKRFYQVDFSLAEADLQANRAERVATLRTLIAE